VKLFHRSPHLRKEKHFIEAFSKMKKMASQICSLIFDHDFVIGSLCLVDPNGAGE